MEEGEWSAARSRSMAKEGEDHGLPVSIENGFSVDVVMHYVKSIGNAHVAPALGRENSK